MAPPRQRCVELARQHPRAYCCRCVCCTTQESLLGATRILERTDSADQPSALLSRGRVSLEFPALLGPPWGTPRPPWGTPQPPLGHSGAVKSACVSSAQLARAMARKTSRQAAARPWEDACLPACLPSCLREAACLPALLDERHLGGVLGRREVLAQRLHVQLHTHTLPVP